MKKRCVIISGSPVFSTVEITPGDYVIAADSGYRHALAAGIVPDLVIGDFDSLETPPGEGIKTVRVSAVKDDTDTMLAVKRALAEGYRDFLILGGTGGRLDHQTANLCTCAYIAEQGGTCEMSDGKNTVYAIKNSRLLLTRVANRSVSVFAFTDKAQGVTLSGLKYPLNNAELKNTVPIGACNEFAADTAAVEVKDGILLVILSRTDE